MKKTLPIILSILLSISYTNDAFSHDEKNLESSDKFKFNLGKSSNNPERDWKVLETEHFLIHYYKGFEKLATDSARIAEDAYFKVTSDLGASPSSKIPIILTQNEFLNGYAEPIKNRIVLDPVLMRGSIIGQRRFLTHEFAHIITYESLNTGFSVSKLYALNNTPTWFMEGVAQYEAEYWYPAYDRMLRHHTLERSILTPSERESFTMLGADEGSSGYNEGFAIVKYIMDTYGHDKLKELLKEIKINNIPFSLALERITGKSFLAIEADWRTSLEEKYTEQVNNRIEFPKNTELVINREKTEASIKAKVSPNGKFFTYMTSKGRSGYINLRGKLIGLMPLKAMVIGEDKKNATSLEGEQVKRSIFSEKEDSKKSSVLTGGVLDYSWSPSSDTIVYTRIDADENGQADTVLGFRSVKLEKNQIKSKYLFDYEYQIFEENDENFKSPLRLISSPIFSKDKRSIYFSAFENEENNIYQVNYRDFERNIKKIKSKKITKVNNYIFQELSLSPDGKKITGRVGKVGDGGNIFVFDLKSNNLSVLTDTSVIYSNCDPSWSEDSKQIYFSSDYDDISNLYSINLDDLKIYKLSNSFRGFEFPFYKDNYLYFTSFFAKGTDIRRIDVNKVSKEFVQNITPYKLPEFNLTNKKENNYQISNYVPWLTPDLIIPLTGVDERGDQFGARISFSDMLYKHAINAAVAYGLVSNKLTYGVGYVNRMFDPVIGIQASEFPSIAITKDGKGFYFQRTNAINLSIARPFFNTMSDQINHFATLDLTFSNLMPIQESVAEDISKDLIRTGRNNTITFGWRSQEINGGTNADIHPLNGYLFDFRLENATKVLGSNFEYTQFLFDVRRYFPLWFNHVLAFRSSLEFMHGDTNPLLLGGPPINLNMGIQDFTTMRGFNIAELSGDRLVMANLEYRFPIFERLNSFIGGIYLDSIYGAFFADSGDAWFDGKRSPLFHLGAGGELRARLGVGGRGTIGSYLGVARRIIFTPDPEVPNNNQFYFGFANSF